MSRPFAAFPRAPLSPTVPRAWPGGLMGSRAAPSGTPLAPLAPGQWGPQTSTLGAHRKCRLRSHLGLQVRSGILPEPRRSVCLLWIDRPVQSQLSACGTSVSPLKCLPAGPGPREAQGRRLCPLRRALGEPCPQTRPQGRALSLRPPERVTMPVLPSFFPAQPGAS